MPAPTIVVEDGTGLANSNSYISLSDAQAYFAARLWSSGFTGATTDNQSLAILTATKVIDQLVKFYGFKKTDAQALQWPRYRVPDPDIGGNFGYGVGVPPISGPWIADNVIPKKLKDCVCELAIVLLKSDRTAEPGQRGINKVSLGKGAISTEFDPLRAPMPIPDFIKAILSVYGSIRGDSINVKVQRA